MEGDLGRVMGKRSGRCSKYTVCMREILKGQILHLKKNKRSVSLRGTMRLQRQTWESLQIVAGQ